MWKYCSFFFKKKIPTTTKFICYPNKSAIQSDWITCHAIDNYKIFPNDIVYELIILAVNLQNTEHICQISIKSIELWFKEYCICWIVTVYEWVCKICVEIGNIFLLTIISIWFGIVIVFHAIRHIHDNWYASNVYIQCFFLLFFWKCCWDKIKNKNQIKLLFELICK